MPRYVLLRHELPPDSSRASHWDFMLEHEGVLLTWALEQLPQAWRESLNISREDTSDEVSALRLADHRLAYLEYEGSVSGDQGSVRRVAAGEFVLIEQGETRVAVRLTGDISGEALLARTSPAGETYALRTSL